MTPRQEHARDRISLANARISYETSYYATTILTKTADRLKLATVAWLKEPLAPWLARADNQRNTAITVPNGNYTLPENLVSGCTENTWTATSGPPDGRGGNTAVWTGSEMIVWGGIGTGSFLTPLNTGGRYNPSTDNWTTTSTSGAPVGRSGHTAVWTGNEMIVWGGTDGSNNLRSGGRYIPARTLGRLSARPTPPVPDRGTLPCGLAAK